MSDIRRVAEHLSELQNKVEEVAERAGVSAVDRLDLRTALAALPWRDRRRLGLVLESARVGAATPALQIAVSLMLQIAGEVWSETPSSSERDRSLDVTGDQPGTRP